MHTGDLLVEQLMRYGVEVIFGVPGGQTVALYDAIQRRAPRVRHVTLRDERSTVYAADAYARLTGKVGVCDVTVGPGAVKLPSGLLEAYNASIPVLAIVSDVNRDWNHLVERGAATQAMDQESLLRPLCKWVTTVRAPEALPALLGTALRRATTGRPGPVALIIPHDVFDVRLPEEGISLPPALAAPCDPAWGRYPALPAAPDPAAVAEAARRLREARCPVMVAGGGALIAGAEAAVRALAEALTMPVVTTFTGRGVLADDHPLSLGLLGSIGTTCARRAVEAADVVLLVGAKSARNSTFDWTLPRADQTVLHLDIDPAEIGKVFPTAVGLAGDARLGLEALLAAATPGEIGDAFSPRRHGEHGEVHGEKPVPASMNSSSTVPPCTSPCPPCLCGETDRIAWVAELRREWEAEIAPAMASDAAPILPQRVMAELNRRTGPDDLVVCDASYPTGWGLVYHPIRRPGRGVLAPRGSAGLGFGLPAAIGAGIACPGRRVIVLAGDGGFSYSLGELASAQLHELPIVAVIFNNSSLAWIDHWHRIYFGGDGSPFRWNDVDFAAVGRGFGCLGLRVERPEELGPALEEALAAGRPAVVDVLVSGEETPIPAYRDAMERGGVATY
jgi:acetolactate synthase I/II/III large subunit